MFDVKRIDEGVAPLPPVRHGVPMSISEAARADLYTGLTEVLGRERAETLMAYLPTFEPTDIATKADVEDLRQDMHRRFDEMDRRFQQIDQRFEHVDQRFIQMEERFIQMEKRFLGMEHRFDEMESRFDDRFAAINGRLDRLFQTLVAGLFVIIAAMVGLVVLAP